MPDFKALRRYFAFPFRNASQIKHEVDEELQSHIDLRVEALELRGMSHGEARAQAMREFGDLDDAKRYCAGVAGVTERRRRASDWLGEIRQDASHTLRILRRAPAFTVATVLILALAVGASTAVYAVLDAYLVRPLPFPNSDRLVSLVGPRTFSGSRGPSLENVDWRTIEPLFEATATAGLDGFTILGGRYAVSATGAWVSPGFFRTFGLRPAIGRAFRAEEYGTHAPVAIISHRLWVERFAADSGVIGSTVTAYSVNRPNEASRITIVGVAPRDFWPIHWPVSDLLRPLPPENSSPGFALLKSGTLIPAVQRQLDAIVRPQIKGDVDPAWHLPLWSARAMYSAGVRPVLFAVLGAALLMFLAACGSVAGALVSRTAARRGELAVRLALGAGRGRVVRQLLTESAVLATIAGVLGLFVAYALVDVSGSLVEQQLGTAAPGGVVALRPTAAIMALSAVVSTLTGIALGLVPALIFLRRDRKSAASAMAIAGRTSSARSGVHVRRVLIAGQVTVAMVLLFGAGLMFRTITNIAGTELGFRTEGIVATSTLLPEATYPDSAAKRLGMNRILARVSEIDGVHRVAAVYPLPFQTTAGAFPVIAEGTGLDEDAAPRSGVYTVSPDYFETMDVPLRSGRTFRATDDQAAPLVVVISQRLARRLSPAGDVIGQRVRVRVPYLASFNDVDNRPWRTVIGVVGDTRKSFAPDVPADISDLYVPYAQNPRARQSIVVRTDRAEASIFESVRRAVGSADPALALPSVVTMTDLVGNQNAQRRGLAMLLGVFATFALGLSALALYASLSYTVVQRQSELAVRMAIGASGRSILLLVIGEGLVTACIGIAGGIIGSLALGRVLDHQLYGVGSGDRETLVAISLVLAAAAIAACVRPGLRAVHTDPALALRE